MKNTKQSNVPYKIVPFTDADLDQVLQLFHDTVHAINIQHYSQEQVNAWAPEKPDRNRWAEQLRKRIAYVAKIGDQIVGFGDASKDGYIDHIYTHKDFQGLGIASAILQKLENALFELQVTHFETEASITAKPFFEKHGYRVIKSQEKMYGGSIFINYVMSKKLI